MQLPGITTVVFSDTSPIRSELAFEGAPDAILDDSNTDPGNQPPWRFRAGAVLLMVMMLLPLVALFVGGLFIGRMRFVADRWGLGFDAPLPKASLRLPWNDIAGLSRREGTRGWPAIDVATNEGRRFKIVIPALSLPYGSRDARIALLGEAENLRPVDEPDLA